LRVSLFAGTAEGHHERQSLIQPVSVTLLVALMTLRVVHFVRKIRTSLAINSGNLCSPERGLQFCVALTIQGIHKGMVRFQKLIRNLFLTSHGHNVHRQQRQLSKFLMRYQQFGSHAYCGATGPVSNMASQQERRSVCSVLRCPDLPPRSPDLTPCDFFLWEFVKDSVYIPPLPMSLKELRDQIMHALQTITVDMLHRVWDEFDYRVDACRMTQGAHIEGL
jgi:hypothetical protein